MNVTAITGASHPASMDAAVRANVRTAVRAWSREVVDYSSGMCWMQTDLFVFPGTWTWGTLFEDFTPGGGIVTVNDVQAGCASVGCRALDYDSYSFMGPSLGIYGGGWSGLSFADPAPNYTFYYVMPVGNSDPSGEVASIQAVMRHEWGHTLDYYFDDYGLLEPMPHPDHQEDFEHRNGDEWSLTDGDTNPDFLRAMMTGDVQDKATLTDQGASAEVWALGPVRKNYPR
jgi:hypothetical protein